MACSGGGSTQSPGGAGTAAGASSSAAPGSPSAKSWAGKDPAPPFPGGLSWFNVDAPLKLEQLKGKVVVLDFWTLGCINCQHIIPDLKRLEAEFPDSLAVIGVHSGKYSTEHDDESIREAIRRFGLEHAVVNDPDFTFWRTYGANAWPTLVMIDPAGKLVGTHAGEGVYPLLQPIIASLVAEFSLKGQISRTPLPLKHDAAVVATVLAYPGKVLADESGNRLFIADSGHNRVLVADLNGKLLQAIGSGKEGFADGGASEATFRQPQGLGLSPDGRTLYVADTRNHALRAVDLATGNVTTIAGTGHQLDRLPEANAQGKATALASPWDVVSVGRSLYIAMAGVHQIWVLDLDKGGIAVFAGTSREGIADGNRKRIATLAQPSGIATDGKTLFWVDPESSSVRAVPIDGEGDVRTVVGSGLFDFGDVDGDRKTAKLQHPQGIALAGGAIYVGDTYNHKIKRVDATSGATKTLAGGARGRADGAPTSARFDEPGGLSIASGKLYVADTNNDAVRVIDLTSGETSTLRLTNLDVAVSNAPGERVRVTLPSAEVAPGVGTLRVTVTTPAGYHLNDLAPAKITFTVADGAILRLSESTLTWSSNEGSVSFPVPVQLAAGSTSLTAVAQIYYCRTGDEGLCFIHTAEITLPVRVTAGVSNGEVTFSYLLPAATS